MRQVTAWRPSPSSVGFPRHSTRIPFENGFMSEVLAEHGYNTYCVGQVASDAGGGVQPRSVQRPLAARAWIRTFLRLAGWQTNNWYPDLVHDNHQIDPPGRPEDGYHVADDLSAKAIEFILREGHRARQAVLHVLRAAGRPCVRTRCRWSGPTSTRANSTRVTRRCVRHPAHQIEMGVLPEGTELSSITPMASPNGRAPTASRGPGSTPYGRGTH